MRSPVALLYAPCAKKNLRKEGRRDDSRVPSLVGSSRGYKIEF